MMYPEAFLSAINQCIEERGGPAAIGMIRARDTWLTKRAELAEAELRDYASQHQRVLDMLREETATHDATKHRLAEVEASRDEWLANWDRLKADVNQLVGEKELREKGVARLVTQLHERDRRILELEEALEPFAQAFRQKKYGSGVSARDWKRAYDAQLLWCIHVIGPETLIPQPDRDTAQRRCEEWNDRIAKQGNADTISCEVEWWPLSRGTHARELELHGGQPRDIC